MPFAPERRTIFAIDQKIESRCFVKRNSSSESGDRSRIGIPSEKKLGRFPSDIFHFVTRHMGKSFIYENHGTRSPLHVADQNAYAGRLKRSGKDRVMSLGSQCLFGFRGLMACPFKNVEKDEAAAQENKSGKKDKTLKGECQHVETTGR
jgi:hypothetical protein